MAIGGAGGNSNVSAGSNPYGLNSSPEVTAQVQALYASLDAQLVSLRSAGCNVTREDLLKLGNFFSQD
jgi:hypothetical protein